MANTVAMPEQVDGSHGSTNVDPNPEVAAPADTLLELYRFPTNKLKGRLKDSSKTPLVLVAWYVIPPWVPLYSFDPNDTSRWNTLDGGVSECS